MLLRGVLAATPLLCLSACASPDYYSQAISGHLDLMHQRKSISAILESGSANPELTRELELSVEIREFAITGLQLPDNASYTQFVETGRDAVTWNVVAAPEFSVNPKQWCFPVSGCVPYRGYLNQQKANGFAAKLARRGYDTTVSPAIAYSTLGWFDDPLLDTMFQYSDEQLAAFIFHELAHQELYVRGDTAFNESYASFVAETGVRLWLESSGRANRLPGWLEQQEAGLQFNALLQDASTKLKDIYSSGLPEDHMRKDKSALFARLRSDILMLVETRWHGRNYFASFLSRELNNASLALVNSYRGGSCAFERLYREANQDMSRFQKLAASRAGLGKEQRREWLNQPCEVIASGTDL